MTHDYQFERSTDNLQLPCVQPPTSSYNFQLSHGHHGHGGHVGHGGRGERDGSNTFFFPFDRDRSIF